MTETQRERRKTSKVVTTRVYNGSMVSPTLIKEKIQDVRVVNNRVFCFFTVNK